MTQYPNTVCISFIVDGKANSIKPAQSEKGCNYCFNGISTEGRTHRTLYKHLHLQVEENLATPDLIKNGLRVIIELRTSRINWFLSFDDEESTCRVIP
jgi:hypothetical protein